MDRLIGLQTGVNVDIKRTDGRVHTAVISGVNDDTNSVTVEWFERGETKGKEIELEALFELNPELRRSVNEAQNILPSKLKRLNDSHGRSLASGMPSDQRGMPRPRASTIGNASSATSSKTLQPQQKQQAAALLQRRASAGTAYASARVYKSFSHTATNDDSSDEEHQATYPRDISNFNVKRHQKVKKTCTPKNDIKIKTNLSPVPNTPQSYVAKQPVLTSRVAPPDEVKGQTTRSTRATRQNGRADPSPVVATPGLIPTPTYTVPELPPEPTPSSRQTFPQQLGPAAVANGKAQRRSNVVKEVERLKKNREERRLKQAELKENQEALKNQDPGNPNWEFMGMIREYQAGIEFRPLRPNDPVETHQITVCVRKRPLGKKDIAKKEVDVITVPTKDQMVVHEPKSKVDLTKFVENHQFRFDYAFDESASNETVYRFTAQPLVQTIFEGGMATCFAYGQTGSGKTHTMGGDFHGRTQDCKKGIYAMAASDVFKLLHASKYRHLNLRISASFFEIYSGKVFDLLANKAKLRVLEDGKQEMQIVGLTERVVHSVDDVLRLIQHGNTARTSGQTSANTNSSRSHAVFQILLRPADNPNRLHGKFSLIDLAGNERGADTSSANRQTRMEGAEINKSLLALKECIRALGKKGAHLPFRASKLTLVLRDSFIGEKSQTCMIAMISPGMSSCEHSLNTLRYADRVKELAVTDPTQDKNSPTGGLGSGASEEEEEDDLRQLRSLNEHELSADLITFHQAVSQLQLMEDDLLECHKQLLDNTEHWREMDTQLLHHTAAVDYDQEEYSQQLEALVEEKLLHLTVLKEKVVAFRRQMVAEEQLSQRMVRPNNWANHN